MMTEREGGNERKKGKKYTHFEDICAPLVTFQFILTSKKFQLKTHRITNRYRTMRKGENV